MRILAALFLVLHGVAHLVGFRIALYPPGQPSREIALFAGKLLLTPATGRLLGLVWLLLALGYVAAAVLLLVQNPSFLLATTGVSLISLLLCALFWPEAKLGLFINLGLLLVLALLSRSTSAHLARSFAQDLRAASLATRIENSEVIDERTLAPLPEPVRNFLRFARVVGTPRDFSVRASFIARFRRDRGEWLPCEVLQYDTRLPIARLFHMQLALEGFLPVTVRDSYLRGRGRMLARAFDLVPVVDGSGPELDVGELVTYLNDAILMAPSLLLGPETSWRAVDARSFDVTLRDGALSVTARVWLDEHGAPKDFSTTDRYFDHADGTRVRTEWRTPVSGWQSTSGRMLPTRAQAVWQLPDGPFPYADFEFDPTRITFNVSP